MRSLALGAIFSSTDSVAAMGVLDAEAHGMLHSLVFGEGVVNDATSIVLLRAVQGIRCVRVRCGGRGGVVQRGAGGGEERAGREGCGGAGRLPAWRLTPPNNPWLQRCSLRPPRSAPSSPRSLPLAAAPAS